MFFFYYDSLFCSNILLVDTREREFLGWLFPLVNISIRWDEREIAEYEQRINNFFGIMDIKRIPNT